LGGQAPAGRGCRTSSRVQTVRRRVVSRRPARSSRTRRWWAAWRWSSVMRWAASSWCNVGCISSSSSDAGSRGPESG
jgi:hypothetical protein